MSRFEVILHRTSKRDRTLAARMTSWSAGCYAGDLNYGAFRECIEAYYRSLVGTSGTAIRIEGGGGHLMRNNVFGRREVCRFD